VGFEPGGGYDFYARLIGNHLGRHLPGRPTLVVKNMGGVGSIKAANFLYANAERDGSVLGVIAQANALEQRLGNPGVKYNAARFNWIGRVTDNVELTVVWHSSEVQSIQDVLKREVVISATSPLGLSAQLPTALNRTAGTRFKVITGYRGSNGAMLAMERGEVEGSHAAWPTLKTSKIGWLQEKRIRMLVQYAPSRHPEMAHVPSMVELARPGNDRAAAALIASSAAIGRSLMAPPGVPEQRIAALRMAFEAMVKDPDFLAEIKKRRADFNPLNGASLAKLIADAVAAPDDIAALAKAAQTVGRKQEP
jgi:tripartite-type tricarboxylate transporter receptor subunit TctC